MVGQFALALAVTAPVFMFANLQLRGIQATDARREYTFGDYLGLRLLTTGLALAAIAGLVLVSGYSAATAAVVAVMGLAKVCESISDVFYGLLQQHEQMDRIARSMMIKGVLSLAVLGAGVVLTGSVLGGAVGLAAVWALLLATYDVRSGALLLRGSAVTRPALLNEAPGPASGLRPRWAWPTLGRLTGLGLPLGLVMLLISLNTNIPRYFIEHFLGTRELGIFAAMAYLMVAGTTVVSALGQSASPRLAQYYAGGNQQAFRTLLGKLLALGAVVGVGGIMIALLAGPPLLTTFYRPEYAAYAEIFFWLMVAAGIGYVASFLGYGMTAARYFRVQAPLFVAVTGATLVACAVLVPSQHLLGAALAAVIAAVVQLVGTAVIIAHALRSKAREV
jgi:O-antigen/teichoic acid export membrane protein